MSARSFLREFRLLEEEASQRSASRYNAGYLDALREVRELIEAELLEYGDLEEVL
jgi:hypothetical protein